MDKQRKQVLTYVVDLKPTIERARKEGREYFGGPVIVDMELEHVEDTVSDFSIVIHVYPQDVGEDQ